MRKFISEEVSKEVQKKDLVSMTEFLYKKGEITKEERDKIILVILRES